MVESSPAASHYKSATSRASLAASRSNGRPAVTCLGRTQSPKPFPCRCPPRRRRHRVPVVGQARQRQIASRSACRWEQVASSLRAGTLDDARRPPPGRLLRRPKAAPPRCPVPAAVEDPTSPVWCRTARPSHQQQYRTTIECGHGIMGGDLMGGVGHVLDGPPRRRRPSRLPWHATRLPRAVRVARPGSGGHPASKGAARAPPARRAPPVACRVRPLDLQRSASDDR